MPHTFDILRELKNALDYIEAYVYIKDINGYYLYANKKTLELFRIDESQLVNTKDQDYFPPESVQELYNIDRKVLSGQVSTHEVEIMLKGEKRFYHEVKSPIYSEDKPDKIIGLLGISTDITLQKRITQNAILESISDNLTKLPNRRGLDDFIENQYRKFKEEDRPFAIVLMDIDHFKRVNDQFGHDIGDEILIEFADLIQEHKKPEDYFGRWGGEEFLLVCTDIRENIYEEADRYRKIVESHTFSHFGQLTASFGLALINREDSIRTLFRRCDEALYMAKDNGRNRTEWVREKSELKSKCLKD